jgi:hypothetical protein
MAILILMAGAFASYRHWMPSKVATAKDDIFVAPSTNCATPGALWQSS